MQNVDDGDSSPDGTIEIAGSKDVRIIFKRDQVCPLP